MSSGVVSCPAQSQVSPRTLPLDSLPPKSKTPMAPASRHLAVQRPPQPSLPPQALPVQLGVHFVPDSRLDPPSVPASACEPESPELDSVADRSPVRAPHASPAIANVRHTTIAHAFLAVATADIVAGFLLAEVTTDSSPAVKAAIVASPADVDVPVVEVGVVEVTTM